MLNGIGNVELVGSIKIGSTEYTVDQLNSQLNKNTTPIGTIFYHISSVPPEGAFLLNGQVIYNCSTLYPEFYQYVTSNNGIRKITSSVYESELSSIGICGGFVVDSENGSVRLPNISNGFIEGSNGSNIGNTIDAGLPNINGGFVPQLDASSDVGLIAIAGNGAFYIDNSAVVDSNPYPHNDGATDPALSKVIKFDASRSNSVYGNSNTVQPKSVCYSVCIQVFNTTTSLSSQESTQIVSELQGKAGINLENLTASGKNIISNVACELDYENRIENLVENTQYLAATNGILSSYATYGYTRSVFYLQTVPPITSTEESGYFGYRIGAYLPSEAPAIGYNLFVPKGWFYCIATRDGTFVQHAKFIPFKNS